MTNKLPTLNIGDLVRVTEDTHDSRLPISRTGLIIECVAEDYEVYNVWMTNGETLKFHSMFLETVTEMPKRRKDEDGEEKD